MPPLPKLFRSLACTLALLATVAALVILPLTVFAEVPKQGNELIAKKVAGGILFQCLVPDASAVYLAGDFNNWADNENGSITKSEFKMEGPDAKGVWKKVVKLEPGVHKFKFCVNGEVDRWFAPTWAAVDSEGNGKLTILADGSVDLK